MLLLRLFLGFSRSTFSCMDGLVLWRLVCFLHWSYHMTVLWSKDRYSMALSSLLSIISQILGCSNFSSIARRLNKAEWPQTYLQTIPTLLHRLQALLCFIYFLYHIQIKQKPLQTELDNPFNGCRIAFFET